MSPAPAGASAQAQAQAPAPSDEEAPGAPTAKLMVRRGESGDRGWPQQAAPPAGPYAAMERGSEAAGSAAGEPHRTGLQGGDSSMAAEPAAAGGQDGG